MNIPWRTILRVILAAVLVWLWWQLYYLVLIVAAATMLAVALDPIVARLQHLGLSRWLSATVISALLIAAIGGFLWATWTSLSDQATLIADQLQRAAEHMVSTAPKWMRDAMGGAEDEANPVAVLSRYALPLAQSASAAVGLGLVAFVVTVYLLIEGRDTRDWLLAFVPAEHKTKVDRTLADCQSVIFGYVAGNVITSVCATVFMLVVLSVLHVPAALLLAVLTGLFDVIPVIGSILPALPAVLLAATVSPSTALLVVAAHVIYNAIENYLIAPWAYGGRLKLSNLAVILAIVVGGQIGGVIGALIALPVAAVYPYVERIWLRSQVGDATVQRHRAIEQRPAS